VGCGDNPRVDVASRGSPQHQGRHRPPRVGVVGSIWCQGGSLNMGGQDNARIPIGLGNTVKGNIFGTR
jgi:hypothetical protein